MKKLTTTLFAALFAALISSAAFADSALFSDYRVIADLGANASVGHSQPFDVHNTYEAN